MTQTRPNLATIAVTQENLSHFNKRLKKAIKSSLGIDIPLSKASEIFAKTCGKDSIHEIQAILQKQQEAKSSLTDFICGSIKNGALDGMVNEIENSFNHPEIQTIAEQNLVRYLNIIKDSVIRSQNILGVVMEKLPEETYLHFYCKSNNGELTKITKPFMSSSFEPIEVENSLAINAQEFSYQNDMLTINELCYFVWSTETPALNVAIKNKIEEYFLKDINNSTQCCIYWNSSINTLVHYENNEFYIERYVYDSGQFENYTSFLTCLNIIQPKQKEIELDVLYYTLTSTSLKLAERQSFTGIFEDNKFIFNGQLENETDEEHIARKTCLKKVLTNLKPMFNQFS